MTTLTTPRIIIILSIAAILCGLLTIQFILPISAYKKALQVERAKTLILTEQAKRLEIPFWRGLVKYSSVILLGMLMVGFALVGFGVHQRLSIVTLRIRDHEIPLPIRTLHKLNPMVPLGLVRAEMLEAYPTPAAPMTRAAHSEQAALPAQSQAFIVPSFGELLQRGELAPGKPLVIGFMPDGTPCRSLLEDNYSTVVFGQSGTGKTTGEAYSIASTVLAYDARYTILDPHYPDKKQESLGDRLGALKHLAHIQIFNNPVLLDDVVSALDQEFEQYKATGNGHVPHIIVVDEHALWKNSSNGGKELLQFEEKIIYEGRKYDWYLHVTSKSPLAKDFGSTAVRDNFVTSLCYKVRKKQARTYFADSELERLVQQCDKPGMVVYTDRNERSQVLHVPQIKARDMEEVVQIVKQANGRPIELSVKNISEASQDAPEGDNMVSKYGTEVTPIERKETQVTPFLHEPSELRATVAHMIETKQETLSGLAKQIGVNKGQIYRFLRDGEQPSATLHSALSHYVETSETPQVTGRNVLIEASDRFRR